MVEKKLVALTFDDGPTPGITDQVPGCIGSKSGCGKFFPDRAEDYGKVPEYLDETGI